jgi:hypothetical protein
MESSKICNVEPCVSNSIKSFRSANNRLQYNESSVAK